jgi:hypothetical protein
MARVSQNLTMFDSLVGKLLLAFHGTLAIWAIVPCAHSQEIPTGFNVERYATVWERNPFTLVQAAPPQVRPSAFAKLYLASWLIDGSKQVILVENSETNELQRIAAEPNQNNMRLVKMRLNQDPRLVEAMISDGHEAGIVKFRYELPSGPSTSQVSPGDSSVPLQNPAEAGSQALSPQSQSPGSQQTVPAGQPYRIYPGMPRVHHEEGGSPPLSGTPTPRLKGARQKPVATQ